ncbi:sensor histidine kinase [Pseudoxanthomonas putridarboris]|uniref:Histidine kinase n=1 Tax=Pseudoxanthomonas putridarboris TaxID=752605 RepID=A0ABU9IXQ3_9GAMM
MQSMRSPDSWIPDFCRRNRLAAMLAIAELVVVLLMIAPSGGLQPTLGQFLSASAFSLWLAMGVAAVLCTGRPWLSRLSPGLGVACALALTGLIAAFGAGVVFGLYDALGSPPRDSSLWRFVAGSAATASLTTALVMRYFYVSDRWAAQVSANARAEADALQARIRPHFLFNSMNMIVGLIRRDPDLAERAVLDLSDLFRAALGAGEGNSTLEKEVELVRQYLMIESLRLGDRLRVDWRLHEPLTWSQVLPRLVLQPLVENAVLHGVSQLPEGGVITLEVRQEPGLLKILIDNGAPPPSQAQTGLHQGSGHAQRNIAYRLAYQFGPRATLSGDWKEGVYRCQIVLPLG